MCGIYGSTKIFKDSIIKDKLEVANFRGPDFSDYKIINSKILFGHNRLSIVDLEKRSNQPFTYDNLVIVFNGEIYNFLELRGKLIKLNYEFKTDSDTEVVCAMYKEYAEKCLNQLTGMFSFVIYDKKQNLLFGARDRLGQKPFFYRFENNEFEFGSNLNQLEIGNDLKLNREACIDYFYFGYFIDPQTPYENVYKLEPGNFFHYDIEKKDLTINKYWSVSEFSPHQNNSSYTEVKHNVKTLLTSAVDLRLKADVPVGLFLSGGVDSSLISSIAKSVKNDINTYSIKFNEKKYDESEESKKIANYLGTNHHTFSCDLNKGKELIEGMFEFYDEPFADISSIPSMLLSSEVKKHVTVALTGDGADELFLGYDRYRWMNDVSNLYKVPYPLRKSFAKALKLIPNYKLKMIAQGISYKNIDDLYLRMMSTFKNSYIKENLSSKISDKFYFPFKELNVIEACSLIDVDLYLNADINTKVDRASMAYSLEARSPFMDHRVVEYSRTIPTEMKFKNRTSKFILKDLLSDYIPRDLFERPKKGFGVPLESWLKKDLKPLVFDCLNSFKKMNLDFINYEIFDNLVNEFYSNKANHSVEIWKMMSFVLWFNTRK